MVGDFHKLTGTLFQPLKGINTSALSGHLPLSRYLLFRMCAIVPWFSLLYVLDICCTYPKKGSASFVAWMSREMT